MTYDDIKDQYMVVIPDKGDQTGTLYLLCPICKTLHTVKVNLIKIHQVSKTRNSKYYDFYIEKFEKLTPDKLEEIFNRDIKVSDYINQCKVNVESIIVRVNDNMCHFWLLPDSVIPLSDCIVNGRKPYRDVHMVTANIKNMKTHKCYSQLLQVKDWDKYLPVIQNILKSQK
jgi:hypothetical protein